MVDPCHLPVIGNDKCDGNFANGFVKSLVFLAILAMRPGIKRSSVSS
jgi:hypothetical protein